MVFCIINKIYLKIPVNHEIPCENYFTKEKYFVFEIVVIERKKTRYPVTIVTSYPGLPYFKES